MGIVYVNSVLTKILKYIQTTKPQIAITINLNAKKKKKKKKKKRGQNYRTVMITFNLKKCFEIETTLVYGHS